MLELNVIGVSRAVIFHFQVIPYSFCTVASSAKNSYMYILCTYVYILDVQADLKCVVCEGPIPKLFEDFVTNLRQSNEDRLISILKVLYKKLNAV